MEANFGGAGMILVMLFYVVFFGLYIWGTVFFFMVMSKLNKALKIWLKQQDNKDGDTGNHYNE